MIRGTCEFCDHPVTTAEVAAWPVEGWEKERPGPSGSRGGANQVLGRKRIPNRIAHASCLEHHLKHGAQEGLFG